MESKNKKVKTELEKLQKLYASLPENKLKLVQGLLENAAYMKVTLDELQTVVNEEGAVITATNGNGFDITQEHPAQKSYNTLINRYASVIKQLTEMLPDKSSVSKIDEFLSE